MDGLGATGVDGYEVGVGGRPSNALVIRMGIFGCTLAVLSSEKQRGDGTLALDGRVASSQCNKTSRRCS